MNPRNRKMFRPRNAGRQAAGILASSPQLMQTVQKRNIGGLIRNQILPDIAIDQIFTPRPFVGNPIGSPSFRTRPPGAPPKSGRSFIPIPGAGNMMPRMGPPVSQGPTGPSFRTRPPEARRPVPGGGLGSFVTGSGETYSPFDFTPIPGAGDMMPRLGPPKRPPDLAALNPRLNVDGPTVAEQMTNSAVSGANTQSQVNSTATSDDVKTTTPDDVKATSPDDAKAASVSSALESIINRVNKDAKTSTDAISSAYDENIAAVQQGKTNVEQSFEDIVNVQKGVVAANEDVLEQARQTAEKATSTFDTLLKKELSKPKELSFEQFKDEAMKIAGVDKGSYDKDRSNAFFFNLMRAGLATAAGESSNAFTNLARGLGIGLEGYGEDIDKISDRERQDKKEIRNIQFSLLKSAEDKEIALAAAENDYLFQQQRLAQAQKAGADQALVAAQNTLNANLLGLKKLDVEMLSAVNSMNIDLAKLETQKSIKLEEIASAERTTLTNLAFKEWETNMDTLPDEFWQTAAIPGYAEQIDGVWKLTPEGEKYYKKLIDTSLKTGDSITDLVRRVNYLSDASSIQGVPLSKDDASRQKAAGIWVTNYKERFEKVGEGMASDPREKISILKAFIKDAQEFLNVQINDEGQYVIKDDQNAVTDILSEDDFFESLGITVTE
tara:strand:- start:4082 stop:6079 length:1998 start_codon:yes stop_codon:yes gene_type:complete